MNAVAIAPARAPATLATASAPHIPGAPLAARIASRSAVVAVVGLGQVGWPLAHAVAAAGFPTLGHDIDAAKLARLDPASRVLPIDDPADLAAAEIVLICVPTPLDATRAPDLGMVEAAARAIAWNLRPGALVVLESTTWPGTTREVLRPILEARGSRSGTDLFIAYSPEREDPGNPVWHTATTPKLVAGLEPAATALAMAFYGAIVARPVAVASVEIAEAAKLAENVFRAVNIALANELKLVLGAMHIDVWQVLEAAATKPFGFMPFWPGPGTGGHCIPVDPLYLAWVARRHGVPARLVELAAEVNAAMPEAILDRLAGLLAARGRSIAGSAVLVVGLGYKRNQADLRESPALALLELLEAAGATTAFHDPLVPTIPTLAAHPRLAGRRGTGTDPGSLARFDAALIATDHDGVDYAGLLAAIPLVVDTRHICARLGLAGAVDA